MSTMATACPIKFLGGGCLGAHIHAHTQRICTSTHTTHWSITGNFSRQSLDYLHVPASPNPWGTKKWPRCGGGPTRTLFLYGSICYSKCVRVCVRFFFLCPGSHGIIGKESLMMRLKSESKTPTTCFHTQQAVSSQERQDTAITSYLSGDASSPYVSGSGSHITGMSLRRG